VERIPRLIGMAEIKKITLSQWLALQKCQLMGLTSAMLLDGALPERPPTRATLVGRFHHRAMEHAATARNEADLDARIESEIKLLQSDVNRWTHLGRVGSVSGWDEVNAAASIAARLVAERSASAVPALREVEQMLHSSDGLMVGKPDDLSIVGAQGFVTEHKSGAIREEGGQIRRPYLDQILFYSALIFDNYDVHSVRGQLKSLGGDFFEIVVAPRDAQEFAARVRALVDIVNAQCRTENPFSSLTTPSADACGLCSARSVCATFKREQDLLGLEGEQYLIEGALTRVQPSAFRGLSDVTISDECRCVPVTIAAPEQVTSEMTLSDRYQLLNLRRHGGSLEWGLTSKVLTCE
jgi:hypothetical protein